MRPSQPGRSDDAETPCAASCIDAYACRDLVGVAVEARIAGLDTVREQLLVDARFGVEVVEPDRARPRSIARSCRAPVATSCPCPRRAPVREAPSASTKYGEPGHFVGLPRLGREHDGEVGGRELAQRADALLLASFVTTTMRTSAGRFRLAASANASQNVWQVRQPLERNASRVRWRTSTTGTCTAASRSPAPTRSCAGPSPTRTRREIAARAQRNR